MGGAYDNDEKLIFNFFTDFKLANLCTRSVTFILKLVVLICNEMWIIQNRYLFLCSRFSTTSTIYFYLIRPYYTYYSDFLTLFTRCIITTTPEIFFALWIFCIKLLWHSWNDYGFFFVQRRSKSSTFTLQNTTKLIIGSKRKRTFWSSRRKHLN